MKISNQFDKKFIRRERRAVFFILLLVIVIHLAGKLSWSRYSFDYDYSSLDSILKTMDQPDSPGNNRYEITIDHEFDPDTVSSQTLVAWGLSQEVALRWIKYRQLVNGFHSGSQIKSIYGIDSGSYAKILPYMKFKIHEMSGPEGKTASIMTSNKETLTRITGSKTWETKPNLRRDRTDGKPKNNYQNIQIDINKASKEDWQKLYGIGPYYAERIMRFRDKLGGFYSVQQVGETYYLPDSVFSKIRPFLIVKTPHQKIEINSADYSTLAGHPYITSKQVNSILNYRNQHGMFRNIVDMRGIISLDTNFISKVSPYFYIAVDTIE